MIVTITSKKVLKIFLSIIFFLFCANVLGILLRPFFEHSYIYFLIDLFNFDKEKNIPTLYSSIALILTSLLLLLITLHQKNEKQPYLLWGMLSLVFLFLSIDETSSIHENLGRPTRAIFGSLGLFYYGWVIPYGAAVFAFGVAYLKFLLALPKRIMMLFVFSGGVFVSGAIGFEVLSAWQSKHYGYNKIIYSAMYTGEELLEMLGIAFFIYALFEYILTQKRVLKIEVTKYT